jgi:hypothetical protein
MSSLSSSSTDQQVWDAYDDNASYEEDASVTKAKAFITACRILLRRRPARISAEGVSTDFVSVENAMNDAREWVALNNTTSNGGSVRHLDFRNLRD